MMTTAEYLKCLADETRLRCLHLLMLGGEMCVCDFTEILALSQPKISRHLALLRQAGLVEDRRQGQWVYYKISENTLPDWLSKLIRESISAFGNESQAQSDRDKYLSRQASSAAQGCC